MYVRASHVCLVLIEVRRGHLSWAVVAHAFNPSTWEAEAGGFLSSRPAWSTEFESQDSQGYTQRNPSLEKTNPTLPKK